MKWSIGTYERMLLDAKRGDVAAIADGLRCAGYRGCLEDKAEELMRVYGHD